MTDLEMLQRYDETEHVTEMIRSVTAGCGLTPAEQARLIGAKTCLSCGAYQSIDGSLPCGH
jgi:hypothetical protein